LKGVILKQLTEEDKKKIKDSVIASCVAKGIKPTVQTSTGMVPNPLYASCIQSGYDDALKHAGQGKLGQWFSKVNTYVQSQGGIIGLLQSISSIAAQYRGKTPDMIGVGAGTGGTGYGTGYGTLPEAGRRDERDNTSLWMVMMVLLLVLIVATAIYFAKGKTKAV
jgi:hypothetical protein